MPGPVSAYQNPVVLGFTGFGAVCWGCAIILTLSNPRQAWPSCPLVRASSGDKENSGEGTTHFAFGEVAGTEGSFYPLSVCRKHLEKTKGAEKGTRQREELCLVTGFRELGGSVGRERETHFFTGILPSGLSCILSFTRLVGQKTPVRPWGWHSVPHSEAGPAGTYILSRKVVRGALAVSGCLARASISSAQSCGTRAQPSGPRP